MYAAILYQVGALKAMLDAEGVPLNHIKPHGELFYYMQRDLNIMDAVIRACATFSVPVFGGSGTEHQGAMCKKYGVTFVEEAYVDIQYGPDNKLLSVGESNTASPKDVYERTMSIALEDSVANKAGKMFKVGFNGEPFLLCIHSDTPTALENMKACRKAVDDANTRNKW